MNNLDIKYGTIDKNIDIKQTLIENHKINDFIYIPDIDDNRGYLFTDPIKGVEKYIFIKINSKEFIIDQNFYVYIDTVNNQIFINCNHDTEIKSNHEINLNNIITPTNKMKVIFLVFYSHFYLNALLKQKTAYQP